MSNTIDIAMVFDTQSITKNLKPGTKDNPTGFSHQSYQPSDQLVFMMVNARYLQDPQTQATANLSVKGYPEDVVRWRAESMSGQSGCAAVIYDMFYFNTPDQSVMRSLPALNVSPIAVPIPNQNDPSTYTKTTEQDAYWQCTMAKAGTVNYGVKFYIVQFDEGVMTTLGWYWWDPSITVKSP
jgi:Inclusion body protein